MSSSPEDNNNHDKYYIPENSKTNKPRKQRMTKVEEDEILNKIYRMMISGIAHRDIRNRLGIENRRSYNTYCNKIRQQNIERQLKERREYFFHDLELTKDQLLFLKRQNLAIINAPDVTRIEKIMAMEFDYKLNMTILKLKYEGKAELQELEEEGRIIQEQYNGIIPQLSEQSNQQQSES